MEWVFDGIGTELISLFVGCLTGGVIGYKIGIKNKISQHQKGRDNANQVQITIPNSESYYTTRY